MSIPCHGLRHFLFYCFFCCLLASTDTRAACTVTGACVTAGPRLANVDSTQSALLNPLSRRR